MTRTLLSGALIFALIFAALTLAQDKPATMPAQQSTGGRVLPPPPMATKIPHPDTTFGDIRIDNYYWLRDKDDPDVIDYLYAENDYTDSVMKPTEALQDTLYKELVGRIQQNDLSVPVLKGDYYYYTREEEGKEYRIYCRKHGSLDSTEQVMLDLNQLAQGKSFLSLGSDKVSPNQRFLAYSLDTTGAEDYTLYFKDLETGSNLPDTIDNIGNEIAWAADNKTIFYTVLDTLLHLPYQVMRHTLGTDGSTDKLMYQENDDAYFLSLTKSRSDKYIFVNMANYSTTEWRYLPADKPNSEFKVIQARTDGIEYSVTNRGDNFLILTNEDAVNFKLMKAPVSDPSPKNWKLMLPERDDVTLESTLPFKNFLVILERENAQLQIDVQDDVNGVEYKIDMPEDAYSIQLSENPEYNTDLLRFVYESMVTPKSVYDYNMDKWTRTLKKQYKVGGGFDKSNYKSERIFATAADGAQVPISLVYRKDKFHKDGTNPLYLYGYGAYGISYDPYFSTNRISILDRGFVFALAHVRGGGIKGRKWYEDGKLLHKKNTFTDFIACAEKLAHDGYCDSTEMFASGGSAGGMTMGAVLNLRPMLFKGIILDVPFVDVLNTMLDPTIPLTVPEYDEWGNPGATKQYYDYIKSYAPYENVRPVTYTNILITAGLNDPRVAYWEPAKLTAKLRATKKDDHILILKTDMSSGHMGPSGRYQMYHEMAFEYAFVLMLLHQKS